MKLDNNPEILIMGQPLLFEVQTEIPVTDITTADFQHNLNVLQSAQIASQGIGIAAPQIGWKACALTLGISKDNQHRYPQAPKIPSEYWINPSIVECSQKTCWGWEGCLSLPGIRAWVERPESVRVTGYDENGQQLEKELHGFHARVFQHEIDHLNGILFTMRVNDTSHIIPDISIQNQSQWPANWPTANARNTPRGELSRHR